MTVLDDWVTVNHAIDPLDPPAELILDAGAVGRLNFQPRYCPAPLECYAARRGDELDLAFAWRSVPLGEGGYVVRKFIALARWCYRIERVDGDVVIARRVNR